MHNYSAKFLILEDVITYLKTFAHNYIAEKFSDKYKLIFNHNQDGQMCAKLFKKETVHTLCQFAETFFGRIMVN